MLISLLLVVIGFGTFYFLPLTFFKKDITLFFMILGLILVLVIIGLTFLCTLIFSALEKLLLWLTLHICCRRDKHIYGVVVKNMEAHSKRNNKTSIMFNMAVSFLIFSASAFELLENILTLEGEQRIGADMSGSSTEFLDEIPISNFLDEQMARSEKPIVDYCFASADMSRVLSRAAADTWVKTQFSDISNFVVLSQEGKLTAVPRNYLNVTLDELYVYNDF